MIANVCVYRCVRSLTEIRTNENFTIISVISRRSRSESIFRVSVTKFGNEESAVSRGIALIQRILNQADNSIRYR